MSGSVGTVKACKGSMTEARHTCTIHVYQMLSVLHSGLQLRKHRREDGV